MIEVDGSDGGGQIVRSAVALAALTGRGVTVEGIRGARPTPGLKHQHVAAVDCLASITDAETEGVHRGSERIVVDPGPIDSGDYEVDIGTAGSATLVADAVLPLSMAIDRSLSVTITGGTDVKWSPPTDYLRSVKLPVLRAHGIGAAVDLRRRGFYPEGGGELRVHFSPSDPERLSIREPGSLDSVTVSGVASADLADDAVSRRLVDAAVDHLEAVDRRQILVDDAPSTGAAVVIAGQYDTGAIGASALGEPGVPAATVATQAVERFQEQRRRGVPVDEHLADQLLVFLAVAGGTLVIPERTEHVRTSLDLLEAFGLPVTEERTDRGVRLSAPRRTELVVDSE